VARACRVLVRIAGLAGAGVVLVMSAVTTGTAAASTGSFGSLASPLTAAVDYLTGLPSGGFGIGPVGLLDDGTSFYVTDWPTGTLYRYQVGKTTPEPLITSAVNNLTDGLALDNKVYYGIAGAFQSAIPQGIYPFDPVTLALGPMVVPVSCGDTRGLATDPLTGDLYLTSSCGLWRISGLTTAHPTSTQLASGNLDGITVSPDGSAVWVATVGFGITEYSPTGQVLASVPVAGGADGVAIAGPAADATLRGDLFVNDNDGTITMVDVHHDNTTSVVASGGSRGDFVTVGPDGFLYATQSDRVEQIQPNIFNPVVPPPPSSTTTSATPTSTTTTAAAVPPTTSETPTAAAQSTPLAYTGNGSALPLLAIGLLATLGGAGVLLWYRRRATK
jgi:sugar lactone lactonase YvrE